MGIIGKIFKRGKREERLTTAPEAPRKSAQMTQKTGQMTRRQKQARARAMVGRKVNRQRLIRERS